MLSVHAEYHLSRPFVIRRISFNNHDIDVKSIYSASRLHLGRTQISALDPQNLIPVKPIFCLELKKTFSNKEFEDNTFIGITSETRLFLKIKKILLLGRRNIQNRVIFEHYLMKISSSSLFFIT